MQVVADPLALQSSHSGGLHLFPQGVGGASASLWSLYGRENMTSLPGVSQEESHVVGDWVGSGCT